MPPSLRFPPVPPRWLVLWFAVALFAIFQHGPMPLYSTRTLAVAWEMWSENQFLVPHVNGHPYSHKVPLLFWLIHAGWAVSGVNDVWPRLLQVFIGAGWLLAGAALARRVFSLRPSIARLMPWFLIALAYSFLFGLQIMYETLLALCAVLALWAIHGRPRWGWFALALGAGLLTKGPVMLLHVAFPLLHAALSAGERRTVIDDALRRTGLTDFRAAYPKQLSGGMRQRVGIARALAVRPAILLMDEPLSALDSQTRELLMEDFVGLLADGAMGAVYVTHNLEEAVRLADRVVVLSRRPGRIREIVTIPMTRAERGTADARAPMAVLQGELWSLIRKEAIDAEREVQHA